MATQEELEQTRAELRAVGYDDEAIEYFEKRLKEWEENS